MEDILFAHMKNGCRQCWRPVAVLKDLPICEQATGGTKFLFHRQLPGFPGLTSAPQA
jgi:hypothetical protein